MSIMKPNRYKKRHQTSKADERLRRQLAGEAARRLLPRLMPESGSGPLEDLDTETYYEAKRQAAAVLGRRVRPGDLPSDSEVRQAALELARSPIAEGDLERLASRDEPEPPEAPLPRLADHVDRFTLYKLRLEPLEQVKQHTQRHPEGDALYHSLQVFQLAREERPYDEEFLTAALLHDVGKAIDPSDPAAAGLESLDGAISERTKWLITHLADAVASRNAGNRSGRVPGVEAEPQAIEDLLLLADLDLAGRVPGMPVSSASEAIEYLKGLENEAYLDR